MSFENLRILVKAVPFRAVIFSALVASVVASPAAWPTTEIALPANTAGEPGQLLRIPVNITDVAGMLGYYFEITYDANNLTCENVEAGGLTAAWGNPTAYTETGRVSVAGMNAHAVSGSGSLATLSFRLSSTAPNGLSVLLHFATAELNDGGIPVVTDDGSIAVRRTVAVSASGGWTEPGATVTLPIMLDDATGILGFYFEVTYDPAVFAFQGVANGNLLASWGAPVFYDELGTVRISSIGATALQGGGSVAVLTFEVSPSAPTGIPLLLHFAASELNDGAIPTTTQDAYITVQNPETMPINARPLVLLAMGFVFARGTRRK